MIWRSPLQIVIADIRTDIWSMELWSSEMWSSEKGRSSLYPSFFVPEFLCIRVSIGEDEDERISDGDKK